MPAGDDFIFAFRRLQVDADRLFVELAGGSRLARAASRAPVDAYLTDDPPALVVQVEAAGADPATIDVELEGDLLVIRGARRRGGGERRLYQHAEIDWGPFERRMRLGVPVDADRARADYDRGLLTVTLPIGGGQPPERIAITVAGEGDGG